MLSHLILKVTFVDLNLDRVWTVLESELVCKSEQFSKYFGLGEALTFRATTTGVLTTLQHCVDLMSRETEQWKKQLDREKENKNKIASKFHRVVRQNVHILKIHVGAVRVIHFVPCNKHDH